MGMKLVQPTDWAILRLFDTGYQYENGTVFGLDAPMVAESVDEKAKYMNNRLRTLEGYRLLRKPGPTGHDKFGRSSVYVITERGRAALELRDDYDPNEDFAALIDDYLRENES